MTRVSGVQVGGEGEGPETGGRFAAPDVRGVSAEVLMKESCNARSPLVSSVLPSTVNNT